MVTVLSRSRDKTVTRNDKEIQKTHDYAAQKREKHYNPRQHIAKILHTFNAAVQMGQKTSKSPVQRGFSGVWV